MLVQQKLSLLYASLLNKQQRKKKNMDLMKDVQTALVIDDNQLIGEQKHEIDGLLTILRSHDIYYKHLLPEVIKQNDIDVVLKNHQLIFMDLYLDRDIDLMANIGLVRKILKKICYPGFGTYGLVLWTQHIEHINLIREKITLDAQKKEYITPLFIVGLDKNKYIQEGYDSLFEDLNNQLTQDKAAAFFFNWRASVGKGADKALLDIYTLMPDYTNQQTNFQYLLYQLADNFSGVPVKNGEKYEGMINDACKAFNELLHSDLITCQNEIIDIFTDDIVGQPNFNTFEDELLHIARINAKLLIDITNQEPNIILPGRIYKVKSEIPLLKIDGAPRRSVPIAIELTPPCDFLHKKVSSRLIGGFMIDCPTDKEEIYKYTEKLFKAGSKYLIWPLYYENRIKFICLDFRNAFIIEDNALRDLQKFEVLFTAKSRLFADILQKFSSHAARLGLAIIQPEIPTPAPRENAHN